MNGSTETLNTCAITGADASGDTATALASSPSPATSCGGLPSSGLGIMRAITSSSFATPTSLFTEVKQTGTR